MSTVDTQIIKDINLTNFEYFHKGFILSSDRLEERSSAYQVWQVSLFIKLGGGVR